MSPYRLKPAEEKDLPAIRKIYTPYVRDTVVSFEYEPPSLQELKRRMRAIMADYPYLVCLHGAETVGYAYAHRHMERAAYGWNAELSVYIAGDHHHRGLGKKLYGALMEILRLQNIKNVYGCVTLPNPGSEGLHAAMGFSRCGLYPEAGYKCGKWHDVAWFEKSIGEHLREPAVFLPVTKINRDKIEGILKNAFYRTAIDAL